jgi:hypothetical protein
MINLMSHPLQKIIFFFTLLMSFFVLQGCGSERDTPFIELSSSGSGSNSSRGKAVSISEIKSEANPAKPSLVTDDKKFLVFPDELSLKDVWSNYVEADIASFKIDFDNGQVVLLDFGRVCDAQKIKFKSYAAYEESINSVIVTFDFTDDDKAKSSNSASKSSASNSSSASNVCENGEGTRPFKFFYVKTKAFILIDENVPAP